MTTKAPRNRAMSDEQGEKFAQQIHEKATRPEGGKPALSRKETIAAIDVEINQLWALSDEANIKLAAAEDAGNEKELTKIRALLHGLHEQRQELSQSKPTRWNQFRGWVGRMVAKVTGAVKPVAKAVAEVVSTAAYGIATAARWVAGAVVFVVVHVVHAVVLVLLLARTLLLLSLVLLLRVVQFLALLLATPKHAVEGRAKAEFKLFFGSFGWRRMQYLDYRRLYVPPVEPTNPGRRTCDLRAVDPKARRRRPVRPPVVATV